MGRLRLGRGAERQSDARQCAAVKRPRSPRNGHSGAPWRIEDAPTQTGARTRAPRGAARPESIFQRPMFMDSGLSAWPSPGMTRYCRSVVQSLGFPVAGGGRRAMANQVQIRGVGMRDGLQSIAEIMPTETKLAWLDAEYAAGVREIEVSSFVPPKLLPQLADAEAVVKHAMTLPGLTVSALIPNSRGAERGVALGVHEMNFVLSVSEGHNKSNVRRSTAESIEDFRRVVALCHAAPEGQRPRVACGLATAFGCTIEGAVDEERVRRIAGEVAEAGADAII